MNMVDFVFVDKVAVGILVSEEGRKRFCGASQSLEQIDGLTFEDVQEAQAFVSRQLRLLSQEADRQENSSSEQS